MQDIRNFLESILGEAFMIPSGAPTNKDIIIILLNVQGFRSNAHAHPALLFLELQNI